MSTNKRSKILGFTQLKNKVNRNAFDLSHRHMFTAQIGELLPIFVQWVNPNETFKIGYNGFTRTQPLQTAAFTRLRENVQYYFVPFQSLWKYFEQQVNNMTLGQSGENISRIAASATDPQRITTGMPYLNYNWFLTAFSVAMNTYTELLAKDINSRRKSGKDWSVATLYNYYRQDAINTFTEEHSDVWGILDRFGRYRYAKQFKLLRALGYCNTDMDSYDLISSMVSYAQTLQTDPVIVDVNPSSFKQSKFGWTDNMNYFSVDNAPNLSIFPLLAYHKIVNDHYRYRQWQMYDPTTCNIDYLLPSDSMNFAAKLGNSPFNHKIFDLEMSNLPLDYFNGVLPKAQYGEESSATVNFDGQLSVRGTTSVSTGQANFTSSPSQVLDTRGDKVSGALTSVAGSGNLSVDGSPAVLQTQHSHVLSTASVANNLYVNVTDSHGSLRISALRNALALQKYKEIQESNDSDFASQVLAHFGIKPKHDDYASRFIGGCDSTIDINPQVNQNLEGDNTADIKAIGSGALSGGCKFTSDTYGIIIGIYRCVPQLDVARVGIDRNLLKTDATDFPIPELDSIGMQTQYRFEVAAPSVGAKTPNYVQQLTDLDMSETYGYLPRYAELKTSYDRVEGAFLDSLKSWVTGYDVDFLRNWINPVSGEFMTAEQLMYCDPHITDSIFVNQFTGCVNDDRLLIGSVNTCVAVRPFSVYGLPYSH